MHPTCKLTRGVGNTAILYVFSACLFLLLDFQLARNAAGALAPAETAWSSLQLGSTNGSHLVSGAGILQSVYLTSDGAGVAGSSDSAYYLSVESPSLKEVGLDLRAKLNDLPDLIVSSPSAQAGIMIREGSSVGSPGVFLGFDDTGSPLLLVRSEKAGTVVAHPLSLAVTDTLRLVSGPGAVYAFKSTDSGVSWMPLGAFLVEFETTQPSGGLIVGGGEVTFDEVALMNVSPLAESVLDDFETGLTGDWDSESESDAYGGDHLVVDTAVEAGAEAVFALEAPVTGAYDIYLRWVEDSSRSDSVNVDVTHSSVDPGNASLTTDYIVIDQRSNGQKWVKLGTYWLNREASGEEVKISNGAVSGTISVDGLLLVKGVAPEAVVWSGMELLDADYQDEAEGSALLKTTGAGNWSGGAFSRRAIGGDGRVQFVADQLLDYRVGLNDESDGPSWQEIDYTIFLQQDGTMTINEGTQQVFPVSGTLPYVAGDTFALERIGSEIRYFQNGVLLHISESVLSDVLHLDTSIYSSSMSSILSHATISGGGLPGDVDEDGLPDDWEQEIVDSSPSDSITSIFDVRGEDDFDEDGQTNAQEYVDWSDPVDSNSVFAYTPVEWLDFVGTDTGGAGSLANSVLRKVLGNDGWNAGAVSKRAIPADGSLRFIVEKSTGFRIGFNDESLTASWEEIDFSFHLDPSGHLSIWEEAQQVYPTSGTVPYSAGDEFSIVRDGGDLLFYRNRELLYTAVLTQIDPLYVDITLYEIGSTPVVSGVQTSGDVLLGDVDEDGLPDDWEQQIVDQDPNDNITSIYDINPGDDLDGDGLTNLQEYEMALTFASSTNPLSWDTDGDGLGDAWEALYSDPVTVDSDTSLDADSDGLTTLEEYLANTAPLLADTDEDGVSDFDEVQINTDPNDDEVPQVLWVDSGGDDNGDGSELDPFETMEHALTMAATGPTVIRITSGDFLIDYTTVTVGQLLVEGIAQQPEDTTRVMSLATGTAFADPIRFLDLDSSGEWSSNEPLWIDHGTLTGIYDAGDTVIFDSQELLVEDTTAGELMTSVFYNDRNGNTVWDAGETLWRDSGEVAGVNDPADQEILGRSIVAFDGANHVYLRALTWSGPGQSIKASNMTHFLLQSQVWETTGKVAVDLDEVEARFLGPLGRGNKGVFWTGNNEIILNQLVSE